MVFYEFEFPNSFHKDLTRIDPQWVPRIIDKIENLRTNPFPPAAIKLVNTEYTYRMRVGDYRVLYFLIEDERRIIVTHVLHRKDAYR
jgi:mRNA interferase RelE/StbE